MPLTSDAEFGEFDLDGTETLIGEPIWPKPDDGLFVGPEESPLTGAERPLEVPNPTNITSAEKACGRTTVEHRLLLGASLAFAAAMACYIIFQIQAAIAAVASVSLLWAWIFLALIGTFVTCLSWYAWGVFRRYWALREIVWFQEQAGKLLNDVDQPNDGPTSIDTLERIRTQLSEHLQILTDAVTPELRDELKTCQENLNRDLRASLQSFHNILKIVCDVRVDEAINTAARRVGLGTALASKHFDGLIILGNALWLVDQVTTIYAGRPDRWGTFLILLRAVRQIVIGELANQAVTALGGILSNRAAGILGGRMAEGATNALMMLRFGEALRRATRPLIPLPVSLAEQMQKSVKLVLPPVAS